MNYLLKRMVALCVVTAACAASLTGCGDEGQNGSVSEAEVVYGLGDSAEGDGVKVTFNSVTTGNGSDFMSPESGNIFVYADFEIENISDEEISVSSMMCFDAYFDDNAYNVSITALSAGDSLKSPDGTISPGKKMNGVMAYEVPEGWKELEIHIDVDLLKSDKLVFETTSAQIG